MRVLKMMVSVMVVISSHKKTPQNLLLGMTEISEFSGLGAVDIMGFKISLGFPAARDEADSVWRADKREVEKWLIEHLDDLPTPEDDPLPHKPNQPTRRKKRW